jgi:ABC-2 type transport system permease protein
MHKVWKVAVRDYIAAVKTKGFIIGLAIVPVVMSGSVIAMILLRDQVDTTDKKIAVLDHTGFVAEAVVTAAEERNSKEVYDEKTGDKVKPAYLIEVVAIDRENPDRQKLALSDRVRADDLHGFVEIYQEAFHPSQNWEDTHIAYYAKNAALDDIRRWLVGPINVKLRSERLKELGLQDVNEEELFAWLSVEGHKLLEKDAETGTVQDSQKSEEWQAIVVPIIMLMLMFILILMGASPLLNAVMEEKLQRIAEVLLGSIQPFQLMLGKLLGGIMVTLTGAAVYILAAVFATMQLGISQIVPMYIIPWFFVYLILAIFMLGSIFAALGSTASDVKDAQSMTFPAMIPVLIPMFILTPVLKEPLSDFSTWMSLVPIFTPMLMMVRMGTPQGIPMWQPWVGLVGVVLFTIFSVWASGRIFRVGILIQGSTPKLSKMIKWIFKG